MMMEIIKTDAMRHAAIFSSIAPTIDAVKTYSTGKNRMNTSSPMKL